MRRWTEGAGIRVSSLQEQGVPSYRGPSPVTTGLRSPGVLVRRRHCEHAGHRWTPGGEAVGTAGGAEARMAGRASDLIAEEQAALRRVATLVARGAPPEQVFAAVTAEVGRLLS